MSALYIILIIIGISAQSVLKKGYNKKYGGGVFVFSAITVLTACLFFAIKSGFSFNYDKVVLPYALGFGAAYCCAAVFGFLAIMSGPLSLTSLATSFSLLIPTFWGIIVDKEPTKGGFYVGLAFLAASLVFINLKDKPKENGAKDDSEVKITFKWAIFVLIALVTNGVCSTVQPVQSDLFNKAYNEVFMVIALAMVFVVLSVLVLIKERRELVPALKVGAPAMVLCGIANGIVNLLVMISPVDKSVMFPLISAGGIVLTWIISMFIYKEKLSIKQNIGMILGVISIVFLNI